jgi:hypothetical protein
MLRSASAEELETHLLELLRSEPVFPRLIKVQIAPADCIMRSWLAMVEVSQVTEEDRLVIEAAANHLRRSFPRLE